MLNSNKNGQQNDGGISDNNNTVYADEPLNLIRNNANNNNTVYADEPSSFMRSNNNAYGNNQYAPPNNNPYIAQNTYNAPPPPPPPQRPFMQQPQFGNIPQTPQQPYNRQYAEQPKKKSSTGMIIILIAVVVFFAVVIVSMSTIMKAMLDKGNTKPNNDENNEIIAENDDEEVTTTIETTEATTMEVTTKVQTVTQVPTEVVPETVTVTVVVEVEKEIVKEVEVPVANNYTVYNDAPSYACVSTRQDPLNIRSTPSKSGKVLGSIPKGKYIDVYYTSANGWYYTTYNGVSGYVSSDYITLILSGAFYGYDDNYNGYYDYPDTYDNSHSGRADVWASVATRSDPLNLRSSPSTNASIITSIPKGSAVYVESYYNDEWCYITWGNYSGYVATQFLAFP